MDSISDFIILDNPLSEWLISLGLIVAVFLFKRHIAQIFAWLISLLFEVKSKTRRVQAFQKLVIPPIGLFVFVAVVLIGLDRLKLPQVLDFNIYKASFQTILDSIGKGILIGSFIWLCNRMITFIALLLQQRAKLTPDRSDDQIVLFFRDFLKTIMFVIGILLILKFSLGYPLANVVTGFSIIGAALALAFKESLENLIASFIIFFDKPFTTGDLVVVDNINGEVEHIGLRSTRIRTADKTYVTVPNKKMVDSILNNHTLRTRRRVNYPVMLNLDSHPQHIEQFISDVKTLLQKEQVTEQTVFFSETGNTAHVITVDYYISMDIPIKEFFELRQRINMEILKLLEQHQLKLSASATPVNINLTSGATPPANEPFS